jgi:hypothetical protein
MHEQERRRLAAIALGHRYVLQPCRDGSPGVMIPESDVAMFPKIRDYFLSEDAARTVVRITLTNDGFIVVPLELLG